MYPLRRGRGFLEAELGDGVLLTARRGWSGIQGVSQGWEGVKTFALLCENIRDSYEESKRFSDFKGKLQMKSPKQAGQSLQPHGWGWWVPGCEQSRGFEQEVTAEVFGHAWAWRRVLGEEGHPEGERAKGGSRWVPGELKPARCQGGAKGVLRWGEACTGGEAGLCQGSGCGGIAA